MSGNFRPQLGVADSVLADNVLQAQKREGVRLERSMMKFAVVGIINNSIGYGTFVILSLAAVPAIPAMTISYLLGMAISFVGNRRWTFGHQGRLGPALMRFLGVNAVGYGLNVAILTFFVVGWHFPQIPVQLFAVGLVAVVTFLLMRVWAFRATAIELEDVVTK